MKKTIKTLLAFLLLTPAVTILAATPSNKERRLTNLNALRLIEDYGSYSTLMNDEAEENFRYIFKDPQINLYNDLSGLSADNEIDLDRYIDLSKDVTGARVVIKNINSGEILDGGDVWLVNVDFDKTVQYNTPCGAIISSDAYFDGKDYHYTAQIEVDKDTYESHISKLNGSIDSQRPRLEPGFAIITKSDPRDEEVTNNGRKLTFSRFDQSFISQPYNLEYADDDVNMKVIEEGDANCRQISFQYRPTRWRVKPHVDISMGNAYKVDAPSGMNTSASGMDFGVDFGYVLPSKGKFKVGIYLGLGLSTGKVELGVQSMEYHYNAPPTADMDGDSYTRYYELSDINQSIKFNHFTVPIYADFEYRFSKRVSAFGQVGIKAYMNAGSKIDNFSASVYSYGVYPQYDNLKLDEDWLNDFGRSEVGVDDIRGEEPFKSFSANLLLGLGARVKIAGPLRLEIGLAYQNAIIDRMEAGAVEGPLASGSTTADLAPVTYTVAGGQVVSNPLSNYCKIKANPLKVKVGLVFAF